MDEEFWYSLRAVADGYLDLLDALDHLKQEVETLLPFLPCEVMVADLNAALKQAENVLNAYPLASRLPHGQPVEA